MSKRKVKRNLKPKVKHPTRLPTTDEVRVIANSMTEAELDVVLSSPVAKEIIAKEMRKNGVTE